MSRVVKLIESQRGVMIFPDGGTAELRWARIITDEDGEKYVEMLFTPSTNLVHLNQISYPEDYTSEGYIWKIYKKNFVRNLGVDPMVRTLLIICNYDGSKSDLMSIRPYKEGDDVIMPLSFEDIQQENEVLQKLNLRLKLQIEHIQYEMQEMIDKDVNQEMNNKLNRLMEKMDEAVKKNRGGNIQEYG